MLAARLENPAIFSGIGQLRVLRDLYFGSKMPMQSNLPKLVASVILEHGFVANVHGIEDKADVISAAVVEKMTVVAKASYMVPHLMSRKGLSRNVCYRFLRNICFLSVVDVDKGETQDQCPIDNLGLEASFRAT